MLTTHPARTAAVDVGTAMVALCLDSKELNRHHHLSSGTPLVCHTLYTCMCKTMLTPRHLLVQMKEKGRQPGGYSTVSKAPPKLLH